MASTRVKGTECPPPPQQVPLVNDLFGLALSGGGIRSATFNLGFLQGLASQELLRAFDYLSTVSGGGFIGGWWSAWLSRERRRPCDVFPSAEEIEPKRRAATLKLLEPGDLPTSVSPDASLSAQDRDPIHAVRLFSNYLTPKTGLMSPDTWRAIAYFVRGLLFTWCALLPILLAIILLAQSAFLFDANATKAFQDPSSMHGLDPRLALLVTPLEVVGAIYATLLLLWLCESSSNRYLAGGGCLLLAGLALYWHEVLGGGGQHSSFSFWPALAAALTIVLFIGRSALKWSTTSSLVPDDRQTWLTQQQQSLLKLTAFAVVVLLAAGFSRDIVHWITTTTDNTLASAAKKYGGWGALCLTVVSGAYTAIKQTPTTTGQTQSEPGALGRVLILIAPPLVAVALLLGLGLFASYLLCLTSGEVRALCLTAFAFASFEALMALYECWEDLDNQAGTAFTWRRFVPHFLLQWMLMSPPQTAARPWYYLFSPRGWVRIVILACVSLCAVALKSAALLHGMSLFTLAHALWSASWGPATVCVLGFALLITLARLEWRISVRSARPVVLLALACVSATLVVIASREPTPDLGLVAFLWIAILLGAVIAFGWLVDPNLISLHGFYKGRIARAYLGASNIDRSNEDITESAPGDDIDLKDLWNHDVGAPYHLVNASLDLVGGSDLATAQRLAENFVMSRYHCGSARAGYRCTAEYMSGGLSLATAVATSGAAVSPLMGSKTPSAALTLLLSLFNVRLGFWAPAPSGKRWYERHARLWPFYLLRETLANTGELSTYCYLTDGGHFDNTALYALIERGCRYIVVCDCGADPEPSFEDIGVAVRRCRIDFGAEIDLTIDNFICAPTATGVGSVHVGFGRITYDDSHLQWLNMDSSQKYGRIVWVKPTVTSTCAADVRQYRKAHREFPQQTTADQWYDESQFESYRRLGFESALQAGGGMFGPVGVFGSRPP